VPATTDLVIYFDQPFVKGEGLLNLRKLFGDTLVESFDVANSSLINFSDPTVAINPANDLQHGIAYYVEIPNSAFINLSCRKPFSGMVDKSTWSFKIASSTGVKKKSSVSLLLILPNPNYGNFSIISYIVQPYSVVDMHGKIVCEGELNKGNNALSLGLNKGLFYLRTESGRGKIVVI